MDQREWDYGARMSRERRAAESRSSRSPDSPDFADPEPKWSSLTDTGSLQPSAEALDWQRRADAWAQQSESDPHQAVEPANRWSDVAETGRPTFPADGVGWRTETAEWRATGARWRQTTEWRSTTGTHVWRSTTEAWQTGGNSSYPPADETPMAQPALSSTAWSDDSRDDSRPAWQQFTDSANEPGTPSRQRSGETTTPSWQQPSPRTPAESSPSWQELVEPKQQPSWNSRPSWQRNAIEGSATWTDLTDQRSRSPEDTGTSWLRSEEPRDDGRHLVREDDRAAWRRDTGGESPSVGRRRAPEPGSAPSGGTGWSGDRSDPDNWEDTGNWARHTDTGSIQLYGDTPAPPSASASWGSGTGFGSRNVNRRDDERRTTPSPYGDAPGYEMPPATPYEPPPRPPRRDDTSAARAVPTGYDEAPRPRFASEDEAPSGRRQRARRYADDEPGYPAGSPGYPTAYSADTGPGYSTGAPQGYSTGAASDYSTGADSGYPTSSAAAYPPPAAEPRASRRARSGSDETATFSAVPMPAPPPAQRSAPPAAPRSAPAAEPRSAPPIAPRSAPAAPRSAPPIAPRSAPAAAPRSGPAGAPKGRARYGGGNADWREQTGSWEAEPDTSSWVRDPDTGQWSRAEDDPRILAWRREAERREAMGEGPRALPAAPAAPEQPEPRPEPTTGGWRNTPPPPLPPGPAPRSATPYSGTSYGPAPTSSLPGPAPRSAIPGRGVEDANPYGVTPSSSVPNRDPYDSAPGYGATPTSSVPGRGRDDDPYDAPRGYSAAPTSSVPGRGSRDNDPYGSPRDFGTAPSSSVPNRDPYGSAPGYGATPTSSVPGRGRDDDRYDPPLGGSYGASRSGGRAYGEPTGNGFDEPTGRVYQEPSPRGFRELPPGRGEEPPTGRGYAEPPTGRGYDEPSSGRGYGEQPAGRGYRDEPANAPRSGTAYGSASAPPYGGRPALPSAPRSAPGYGDDATTVYPAAPASGVPGGPISSWSSSAPVSSPGRRGAVDPSPYGAEPVSPEVWQPGPRSGRSDEVAPWTLRDPVAAGDEPPDQPSWALEERRERARGSAVYREGGGGDWRRDLADQSDLAEGESRRFGTADYVPFRSGGSAAVQGQSNLSTTSTSLISPVARDVSPTPAARGGASWNGPSGAYERRPVTGAYPTGRKSDLLDPDDEEGEQESGGPLAAVGYTVIWYGVPVVLFVAYMLVVGAGAQGHAFSTLAKAAPQFLISLVLSVVVAIGLRFVSHSWKAISVGLAAAVVGGGLATVLTSAITGNSLS
ncbi:hypothetical protein [Paractinoplanes brasiliensis]|uniref:Uncharacterized protein n=1 Tax=Paractinoplanes brasiliensis TaxID=52695 RepID=A0A4R6JXR8_9ACTN|nr:hypothetical protein [Actinoplanes brasiliensis]TDO39515.1 hypothetical protein C8E87_3206 [Actinoplanes brasiliensis]